MEEHVSISQQRHKHRTSAKVRQCQKRRSTCDTIHTACYPRSWLLHCTGHHSPGTLQKADEPSQMNGLGHLCLEPDCLGSSQRAIAACPSWMGVLQAVTWVYRRTRPEALACMSKTSHQTHPVTMSLKLPSGASLSKDHELHSN